MIEKHIQRLEDLVKQSPETYSDGYLKTALADIIQNSKAALKFESFLN
jgi:hypothetical protein